MAQGRYLWLTGGHEDPKPVGDEPDDEPKHEEPEPEGEPKEAA